MTLAECATNAQLALDALAAGDLAKARRLLRQIAKAADEDDESREDYIARMRHESAQDIARHRNAELSARIAAAQRPAAPLASSIRPSWGRRRL